MSDEAVYRTAPATPGLLKSVFVTFVDDQNHESWRHLVKERIANIGKLRVSIQCTWSTKYHLKHHQHLEQEDGGSLGGRTGRI